MSSVQDKEIKLCLWIIYIFIMHLTAYMRLGMFSVGDGWSIRITTCLLYFRYKIFHSCYECVVPFGAPLLFLFHASFCGIQVPFRNLLINITIIHHKNFSLSLSFSSSSGQSVTYIHIQSSTWKYLGRHAEKPVACVGQMLGLNRLSFSILL